MPHLHAFGHVARHLHPRSPQDVASTNITQAADGGSNPYVTEIVNHSKSTTIVLAVIVAILALVIIAGSYFYRLNIRRLKSQRNNNVSENGQGFGGQTSKVDLKLSEDSEKSSRTVFNSDDNETGWKPQFKEYRGVMVTGKQYEKNMKSSKARSKWEKAMLKDASNKAIVTPQNSPPLNYMNPGGDVFAAPKITIDSSSDKLPTPPLTPGNPDGQTLVVPSELAPGPLPSPARSASFAHQQFEILDVDGCPKAANGKPARLMTVTNIFIRSLDDELAIKVGETVRMYEEYQDGWCFCQHVGKADAPKGVVPRFCLVDFKKPLPGTGGRNLTDAFKPVPV